MRVLPNNRDMHELARVFEPFGAVDAVFLFGSTVTGRVHRDSDLDLGVAGDAGELQGQRLNILKELARHGFGRVDVVLLGAAPPALAYQVVKHRRVVYCREGVHISTMFSKIVRQYLDIRPVLEYQAKRYKERLLHGQP